MESGQTDHQAGRQFVRRFLRLDHMVCHLLLDGIDYSVRRCLDARRLVGVSSQQGEEEEEEDNDISGNSGMADVDSFRQDNIGCIPSQPITFRAPSLLRRAAEEVGT